MMTTLLIAFFISLFVSVCMIPLIIKVANRFQIVDKPNKRNVHKTPVPSLGGLAIIAGTAAGLIYLNLDYPFLFPVIIGAIIIIVTGVLDDKFNVSAKIKFTLQLVAASVVVASGIMIKSIDLPFIGGIELGVFSYIISVLWIVGVTNSINLIDGLDGLAGGVAIIAISSIVVMAIIDPGNHLFIISLSVLLIGSTLGFLCFNFHPAKIFMGDTGALFLGYSIAVISILGLFKSVTVFSLLIPIIILAVPIFDTVFAIIRRTLNKQKIYIADKGHLHHCLLAMGYSHRKTVLIVYGFSFFFGVCAILFTNTTLWASVLLFTVLLIVVEVYAEFIGLMGQERQPLINAMKRIFMSSDPTIRNKRVFNPKR
ncbi:MraY family glycosyltransferase [Alkalihalobacillus sp. LMS39]|uniref:glycosyltransferase family 4 protein n=1 Tax=Alkalihalobacillus sp. LMS39 TaxID=2924032 RepID=UPI001FB3528A|nr:MraY family glycosyltransferase [Alkalihalobacillus sp. LMS39]UOE93818.1 undecaprenyl/decaprenyl-phosphate alpha-N-acetylglucosaminyl 1-phosphate transferase [Alkalihalobacillus sp. LMS39]